MIKRFIVAAALLVVVCGGLIGFNVLRDNAIESYFAGMKPPPVTVSAIEVESTTWTPGIAAVGTVYASRGVDVAAQTAGVVAEIAFEANERVAGGDILVQIDDAVERADLLAARTALKVNQQALDRARTLAEKGVNSAVTTDNAAAELDSAKSQLARIEAVLAQKAIRAPFSGTIGIPRVDIGQYVQPGTVIATLQDLDTMKVEFTVPEQNRDRLSVGQPVRFGLTEGAMTFSGSITGVDPKIDPSTRLVSAQASLDDPRGALRPGQFIRVEVALPPEQNIVAMPQTAVIASLYGDYVFVVDEEAATNASAGPPTSGGAQASAAPGEPPHQLVARQVFVKTGRRSDGMIEIVEGLAPGERVVTSGQNKLSSGTPLNIDNTVDPSTVIGDRRGS